MKNLTSVLLAAIIALVLVGSALPALAKAAKGTGTAKEVSQPELPMAVTQSLQMAFPGAVITEVSKENENNVQVYDIETRDGMIERDLIFGLDGTLLEVGEHIPAADLPAAVRDATNKAFPGGSITEAERKTIGGTMRYDVTVQSGGASHELYFSPAGAILNVTDDEDDGGDDGDDD
ncbi:MAG: PepSY-like domain-containing protein [bacterium]|nr:PepSY-like domain-containing protein [bacterium]